MLCFNAYFCKHEYVCFHDMACMLKSEERYLGVACQLYHTDPDSVEQLPLPIQSFHPHNTNLRSALKWPRKKIALCIAKA